jgi:predicted acyltransferase
MFSLSSNFSSNFLGATTYTTPYPSNTLNKATNFKTMFDTVLLPYNKMYNGCSSNFCYTTSKGLFIYKPHADVGMVGRFAAGYLFQRKRM